MFIEKESKSHLVIIIFNNGDIQMLYGECTYSWNGKQFQSQCRGMFSEAERREEQTKKERSENNRNFLVWNEGYQERWSERSSNIEIHISLVLSISMSPTHTNICALRLYKINIRKEARDEVFYRPHQHFISLHSLCGNKAIAKSLAIYTYIPESREREGGQLAEQSTHIHIFLYVRCEGERKMHIDLCTHTHIYR